MFEHFIRYIAPHSCVVCKAEGPLLCSQCSLLLPPVMTCYEDASDVAQRIISATRYDSPGAKALVHAVKFERAREAALVMAEVMHKRLPPLPDNAIVTYIPTANNRVRQRGYDQAALIARDFARVRRCPYIPLLARLSGIRQVGASAQQRREQVKGALAVTRPALVRQQPIIVIDDVVTTGATMREAQAILQNHQAPLVIGYCFAFAPPSAS